MGGQLKPVIYNFLQPEITAWRTRELLSRHWHSVFWCSEMKLVTIAHRAYIAGQFLVSSCRVKMLILLIKIISYT